MRMRDRGVRTWPGIPVRWKTCDRPEDLRSTGTRWFESDHHPYSMPHPHFVLLICILFVVTGDSEKDRENGK